VREDGPAGGEHQVIPARIRGGAPVWLDDLRDRVGRLLHAGDQAVSVSARELRRLGAACRHQDRHVADRRRVELGCLRRVVLAVEGDLLPGQHPVHDLQRFLHAGLTLGVPGEREAERPLVQRLAGADAEEQPAVRETVGGRGHLRDQRWMVVEQRAGHRGAQLYVRRLGRHRAEPRPDEARRRRVVHPGMEVVAAEHHVETGLFGRHGLLNQVLGLVGLVTAQPGELHLRLPSIGSFRSSHWRGRGGRGVCPRASRCPRWGTEHARLTPRRPPLLQSRGCADRDRAGMLGVWTPTRSLRCVH